MNQPTSESSAPRLQRAARLEWVIWLGAGYGAAIFGAFVLIELAVGGFEEFGGGAAVIRVYADVDADADGRFALMGLLTVLDAVSDLLGHAFVGVDVNGSARS